MPKILENLGVPSAVILREPVQYEPNSDILGDLVLIYEDVGFSIEYNMSSFTSGYSSSLGFCFIEDWLRSISLRVTSPAGGGSLLGYYSKHLETGYFQDFLDVSELTLEDFYTIGRADTPDPCFRLKDP
jgi:hypothetical protein